MSHADTHSHGSMPKGALVFCWTAVILSLAAATIGRLTGAADSRPTAAPVIARELVFHDRANGAVAVYDARDMTRPIEMIAPQSNYFLRATMRGLAQQRIRVDASRTTPFRLTEWADGRLTLEDPTTGRRIDLEAFGKDNEQVFANLLLAKAGS